MIFFLPIPDKFSDRKAQIETPAIRIGDIIDE